MLAVGGFDAEDLDVACGVCVVCVLCVAKAGRASASTQVAYSKLIF